VGAVAGRLLIPKVKSLIQRQFNPRAGHRSTILLPTFRLFTLGLDEIVAVPLVEPEIRPVVYLVFPDREALPPVAKALFDLAKSLKFKARVDHRTASLERPGLSVHRQL